MNITVTGGALKLYGERASYGRIERELLGVPGVVCTGLVTQGIHTLLVADPQQGVQILDQARVLCIHVSDRRLGCFGVNVNRNSDLA